MNAVPKGSSRHASARSPSFPPIAALCQVEHVILPTIDACSTFTLTSAYAFVCTQLYTMGYQRAALQSTVIRDSEF